MPFERGPPRFWYDRDPADLEGAREGPPELVVLKIGDGPEVLALHNEGLGSIWGKGKAEREGQ